MGNSEAKYLYSFKNPMAGHYNLSAYEVFKVDNEESEGIAKKYLADMRILYVDCEGEYFGNVRNQELCLVQVATNTFRCFVFHVIKYPRCMDNLKILFEDANVMKVFHDCSGDASVLYYEYGISLRNVHDSQVAHKVIDSQNNCGQISRNSGPSLSNLCEIYCNRSIPGNKRFNRNKMTYPGGNIWRDNEELTDGMVMYAVLDVLVLREIFQQQFEKIKNFAMYEELVNEQIKRKINHKHHGNFPLIITSNNETGGGLASFLLGGVILIAALLYGRQ